MADSQWVLTDEEAARVERAARRNLELAAMDIEPIRMALQPGTVKTSNGRSYALNRNHRWERVDRPTADGPHPAAKPTVPARPHPAAGSVNVEADPNHDGITDAARVGVPAWHVPPPPRTLRRLPNLPQDAQAAQERFCSRFERHPELLTANCLKLFRAATKPGQPVTFGTDDAKALSRDWNGRVFRDDKARRSVNRATLNTALHQAANAIAKRAFLAHLDTLPEGAEIMVTVGGCGAGKGFALKNVPQALEAKQRASAVWDSAGDQNATENPWILAEATKRGLKVTYVYVHADPHVAWAHPERGVVKRAQDPEDGRMVDARVFADSYAIGARNHHAFATANRDNPHARFLFLANGSPPSLLDGMPAEALATDRHELARFAVNTVRAQPNIPEHVRRGALQGTQIWSD